MQAGKGYFDFFKKLFVQSDGKEDSVTPLSTSEMAKRCLHLYLKPYKAIMLKEQEYPEDFKVDLFVRQMRHIYQLHQQPMVQHPLAGQNIKVSVQTLPEVSFHSKTPE